VTTAIAAVKLSGLNAEAMALRDRLVPLADLLLSPHAPTDPAERMRIERQCLAMTAYLIVLVERIEASA
jgi:hypothetical protein